MKNKVLVFIIFALPSILLSLPVFYFAGIPAGVLSLALLAFIGRYIYGSAYRIILKWYSCEPLSSAGYDDVRLKIIDLSERLSVKRPEVLIFDSTVPVIFSIGNTSSSRLLISRGLLETLDEGELEAVMIRELAHMSGGDLARNTFMAMVSGLLASLSTVALWMALLGGFGQEDDPAPKFIRFIAMGLVMLPASLLIYLGVRDTVLSADAKTAEIMGTNVHLASALRRIYTEIRLHSTEYFNPAHAQLFVVNPVKVNSLYDIHLSLFVTKPDMQQRLTALGSAGTTLD